MSRTWRREAGEDARKRTRSNRRGKAIVIDAASLLRSRAWKLEHCPCPCHTGSNPHLGQRCPCKAV